MLEGAGLLIPQIFIEHLLYARHGATVPDTMGEAGLGQFTAAGPQRI